VTIEQDSTIASRLHTCSTIPPSTVTHRPIRMQFPIMNEWIRDCTSDERGDGDSEVTLLLLAVFACCSSQIHGIAHHRHHSSHTSNTS